MTLEQKLDEAKKQRIYISNELLTDVLTGKNIVGVYGFFAIKENEEYCFYIGKSTSIADRLFGASNGHIYLYLNNDYSKLVPQEINKYLHNNYKIEVRILEKIDYHDTSFSKAAHRLALAELQKIVQYQEQGQCELQLPEGSTDHERRYWEKHYKK